MTGVEQPGPLCPFCVSGMWELGHQGLLCLLMFEVSKQAECADAFDY